MKPDQPPQLFVPTPELHENEWAYYRYSDIERLTKSAIEREEYLLKKLEPIYTSVVMSEIFKRIYELENVVKEMRKSR
jgi:hypothetical protein